MTDINADDLIFISGAFCCFGALYTDFPALIGCTGKGECLCIEKAFCCKPATAPYPVGVPTVPGYIFKVSLYCCELGIKTPTVCCKGKSQSFCCVNQVAFPPDGSVPTLCGTCFISCYPKFGVFQKVSELK